MFINASLSVLLPRAVGRSKNPGGIFCPAPEIWLTYLPKSGGGGSAPYPQFRRPCSPQLKVGSEQHILQRDFIRLYLLVQLKLIGCLWQQKHLQKYSFLITFVPDLQNQNCLNKVWTRFINYDFLTEKHRKLLLSCNKFESNGKIWKKSSTNLLSTYIIASLFSTCLARFYFSFKIYMAENHLDFCINRYLVWIIFGNVYNFEKFTKYAFSTKGGHIFPK